MTQHELIHLILKQIQEGPQTADSIFQYLVKDSIDKKPTLKAKRAIERRIRTAIDAIETMGYDRQAFETTGRANQKTWYIKQSDDERNGRWLIRGILPRVFSLNRQKSLNDQNRWLETEPDPFIDSTHFYETEAHNSLDSKLKTVIHAIANSRKLRINSMDGDATSVSSLVYFPILVLPIRIIYHRGCFYLAAVADQTRQVLTFQIDQLNMTASDDIFDRANFVELVEADLKKRFGISQNINNEEYDIKLRFSSVTGAFVDKQFWTDNVMCIPDGDDWLVTFRSGINRELVGWIFQWMSNVRVIEPPRLKELYDEQLARMLAITNQDPDAPVPFTNAFAPEQE